VEELKANLLVVVQSLKVQQEQRASEGWLVMSLWLHPDAKSCDVDRDALDVAPDIA